MTLSSEFIAVRARESAALQEAFCREEAPRIAAAAGEIVSCLRSGGKVMSAGNGGSAADAQHFAAELVNRFLRDRRPLPGLALTTDTSILTAVGNDCGFEETFSKQVEALGRAGDVLLAISTSGRSPNILRALESARRIGLVTIGLTGRGGSPMAPLCDLALAVPSDSTPRVQEVHHLVIHLLCEMVENQLFPP